MVIVFAYVLYYTKLNIFTLLTEMLQVIIEGGVVDPEIIQQTSKDIDRVNIIILSSMIVLATITGIIAARITLVPAQEELSRRKKFITAVAHELRTPLAVLLTSNEVALYDLEDSSPHKKIVEENIEEVKHLSNILNQLVIFSRIDTVESFSFEPIQLEESLQTVIKKLSQYAGKHSVDIKYDHSSEPSVIANKTAVEQTFYNLIKNAIVYSKPAGGSLKIETKTNGAFCSVSFADNGIGMSNKNLQHIFEPFYRINPDNSQWAAGKGLGLSLVFEIMKLHRGTISVESTMGQGTTFTLQFPVKIAAIVQEPLPQNNNNVSFSFE